MCKVRHKYIDLVIDNMKTGPRGEDGFNRTETQESVIYKKVDQFNNFKKLESCISNPVVYPGHSHITRSKYVDRFRIVSFSK
jgi:hypothetical protein